jgi:hypothetical protein
LTEEGDGAVDRVGEERGEQERIYGDGTAGEGPSRPREALKDIAAERRWKER